MDRSIDWLNEWTSNHLIDWLIDWLMASRFRCVFSPPTLYQSYFLLFLDFEFFLTLQILSSSVRSESTLSSRTELSSACRWQTLPSTAWADCVHISSKSARTTKTGPECCAPIPPSPPTSKSRRAPPPGPPIPTCLPVSPTHGCHSSPATRASPSTAPSSSSTTWRRGWNGWICASSGPSSSSARSWRQPCVEPAGKSSLLPCPKEVFKYERTLFAPKEISKYEFKYERIFFAPKTFYIMNVQNQNEFFKIWVFTVKLWNECFKPGMFTIKWLEKKNSSGWVSNNGEEMKFGRKKWIWNV